MDREARDTNAYLLTQTGLPYSSCYNVQYSRVHALLKYPLKVLIV